MTAALTRSGPETIFEAETQIHADPAAMLSLMRRLGVDRVRVFISWGTMAPGALSRVRPSFDAAQPAGYGEPVWAIYDAIVRDAAARHVGLDFTLGGPAPLWAAGRDVPSRTAPGYFGVWKPSPAAFGQFVRAVALRYSGHYTPPGAGSPLPHVGFWSIWNEPNYGPDLAPQATDQSTVEVSPAMYRRLVDAAWSALQATGHSHDKILIGETAPRGITAGADPIGNFSGMVPLRFIRALYCVDQSFRPLQGTAAALRDCPTTPSGSSEFPRRHPGLFEATGFADHPYPQGAVPPNVATPDEPDYADLATIGNLERTLDGVFTAYGSHRQLPIYNTEFGYQTNPPETIARAIDPAKASLYMNQAEYIGWKDTRLVSWDQYLLTDPPAGNFATGIEFADGRPKATYDAFRMPIWLPVLKAAHGRALDVWGCVRPVHFVARRHKPQVVSIQFKPATGGAFRTIKKVQILDPYGYFDVPVTFPSSGSVRTEWAYPGGERIHSRIVQITVS